MKVLLDIDEELLISAKDISKKRKQSRKAYLEALLESSIELAAQDDFLNPSANENAGKGIIEGMPVANYESIKITTKETNRNQNDPPEGTNAFYIRYGAFYYKDLK